MGGGRGGAGRSPGRSTWLDAAASGWGTLRGEARVSCGRWRRPETLSVPAWARVGVRACPRSKLCIYSSHRVMAEPLPPAGKVIKIAHHFTVGSDAKAMSRIYWQYTGTTPNATTLKAIAEAVQAAWEAHCQALTNSETTLTAIDVIDLSGSEAARYTLATSIKGSHLGGCSAGVCSLQNHSIPRRYRGGKPRTYWPWGSDSDRTSPQLWSATWVSNVNTKAGEYFAALAAIKSGGTELSTHCNVSYYHGFTNVSYGSPPKYRRVPTPRATPVVDTISASSCNSIPGSQRRRYGRRG